MEIDWRGLLDSLRVPWADRGHNTSKGNISIACPRCQDDPSHHLAIAEHREAYYCYRDPNRHSGKNFIGLLISISRAHSLGIDRNEAIRLLNYYRLGRRIALPAPKQQIIQPLTLAWDRFAPATDSKACIDYLANRGFEAPRALCERFDLRYAPSGQWAKRLLMPLHQLTSQITWTGRDISGQSSLAYRVQEVNGYNPLYLPDAKKPRADTLVIVEGPMDALKIAYDCRYESIIVAALCGKGLNAAKILQLRGIAKDYSVLLAVDADVPISQSNHMISELAPALQSRYIGRVKMPEGIKDPGEILGGEVLPWLRNSFRFLQSKAK